MTAATVLSVGPAMLEPKQGRTIPLYVKPGDRVLIDKYVGHDVMFSDGPAVVIGQDDLLGAIDAEEGKAPIITGGDQPIRVRAQDTPKNVLEARPQNIPR